MCVCGRKKSWGSLSESWNWGWFECVCGYWVGFNLECSVIVCVLGWGLRSQGALIYYVTLLFVLLYPPQLMSR